MRSSTRPARTRSRTACKHLLVGEDPLDVERLWQKMYRGLIYIGRRGIAVHAISGIDIALWDIAGKAAGKPVCELIGTPKRDKVRAYASMLMPDEPGEVRERVSAAPRAGLHRGQARLGAARRRSRQGRRARSRRRRGGRRGRHDPDRRGPRLRQRREDGDRRRASSSTSSASSGSRSRSSPTSTRPTPSLPTRSRSASPPASRTRRSGASAS